MGTLTYSAGPDQPIWHDKYGRIDFPAGQKLYGRAWDLVVTDLAEDLHDNHDGWEAEWPLQIRIYEDDAEVARFSVEREHVPQFSAWEIASPLQPDATPSELPTEAQTGRERAEGEWSERQALAQPSKPETGE
jgi:hypothetical protein